MPNVMNNNVGFHRNINCKTQCRVLNLYKVVTFRIRRSVLLIKLHQKRRQIRWNKKKARKLTPSLRYEPHDERLIRS